MWGQLPTSSAVEIGAWMVAAAAVVAVVVLVLTLIEKWRIVFGPKEKLAREDEPVTRADLDKHLKESDEAHDKNIRNFQKQLEELVKKIDLLEQYWRTRYEGLLTDFGMLQKDQLQMPYRVREMLDKTVQPIMEKLEENRETTLAIAVRLKVPVHEE